MKNLHAISQNTALFFRLLSLENEKRWNTSSDLVHRAFKNRHKTDGTSTMVYSSLSEHSREEAKVAHTPAGVKLFPQAISALSILAYDTCKLVNISSIVALMTVKACYLWLWKQCAKCDMILTDCCMNAQNVCDKYFLHQVSSLTLIQTFSLWSLGSIRAQGWNTVPFIRIKRKKKHCTCSYYSFLLWMTLHAELKNFIHGVHTSCYHVYRLPETTQSVQFGWVCAYTSLRFVFVANGSGPPCGLVPLKLIHFKVQCFVHAESDYLSCYTLPGSSNQSDLSYQQAISMPRTVTVLSCGFLVCVKIPAD